MFAEFSIDVRSSFGRCSMDFRWMDAGSFEFRVAVDFPWDASRRDVW